MVARLPSEPSGVGKLLDTTFEIIVHPKSSMMDVSIEKTGILHDLKDVRLDNCGTDRSHASRNSVFPLFPFRVIMIRACLHQVCT